jgi:hypothetical protein
MCFALQGFNAKICFLNNQICEIFLFSFARCFFSDLRNVSLQFCSDSSLDEEDLAETQCDQKNDDQSEQQEKAEKFNRITI